MRDREGEKRGMRSENEFYIFGIENYSKGKIKEMK